MRGPAAVDTLPIFLHKLMAIGFCVLNDHKFPNLALNKCEASTGVTVNISNGVTSSKRKPQITNFQLSMEESHKYKLKPQMSCIVSYTAGFNNYFNEVRLHLN